MRVPVLIVGAGVSGLSAAYHLDPEDYLLIEKESTPGGLARTIQDRGFSFDYTGHYLHLHDPYSTKLVKTLLGSNLKKHNRSAWIYSHGGYHRYPFQANTYGLPTWVKQECIDGFKKALDRPQTKVSPRQLFSEWVLSTFGEGFAKHFFFPYNKKLWCVDPHEMTSEWVGMFVPRPTMDEVVAGSLDDDKKAFGYNATFYYPEKGGVRALVDGFLKTVTVQCNTSLMSLNSEKHTAVIQHGDEMQTIEYDHLINTIPLPNLLRHIEDLPDKVTPAFKVLRSTQVECFNIGVRDPDVGEGRHWVYFPDPKVPFYRVGFPSNVSKHVAPEGCGSISVEVSRLDTVSITQRERTELMFSCLDALKECKILKSTEDVVTLSPLTIRPAYVLYDQNRTSLVTHLLSDLQGFDIHSIGRYGSWEYSFIERNLLEGRDVVKSILDGVSA